MTIDYSTDHSTNDTAFFIKRINEEIEDILLAGGELSNTFFLRKTAILSSLNVSNGEGGPFAALVIKEEDGKPVVIGIGANHVVPENDPSAHGEVTAIRDTAKNQGYTDLKDAVLYTSCECCPMCLSTANGVGIKTIIYTNTRQEAAEIGFSDEEQYALLSKPLEEQATHIDNLTAERQALLLEKLEENDVVIIDASNTVIAHANNDDVLQSNDPTGIASIRVIQKACDQLESFHLPEDYTVIARKIPHPAGIITMDWARIGRVRDKQNPDDPSLDKSEKDSSKIIYVESVIEEMPVRDECGAKHIRQTAQVTYNQPSLPDNERAIPTIRDTGKGVHKDTMKAFEQWRKIIGLDSKMKY